MFRECIENSTAHGIPHLANRNNKPVAKFIWILIFIGSLAVFLIHSSSLIEKYLLHETAVSVNLDAIDFILPDVYICSNYRFSKMLIDRLYSMESDNLANINNYLLQSNVNNLAFFDDWKVPGYTQNFVFNLLSNRSYLDIFTDSVVKQKELADPREIFDLVPHDYHTYCYKLKDKYKSLMFQISPLTIYLYTDAYRFMEGDLPIFQLMPMESSASHTVYVVPQGRYPAEAMPNSKIEIGKDTTLSVTMDYYDKVYKSKNPCLDEGKIIEYKDNIDVDKSIGYIATPYDCSIQKFLNEWIKRCNCTQRVWPLQFDNVAKPVYDKCDNDKYSTCFWNNYDKISVDDNSQCEEYTTCKLPVYSIKSESISLKDVTLMIKVFDSKVSGYPFNILLETAAQTFEIPPIKLQNSFAKVTIIAPKRRATVWKEFFAYELKDLLSDIGGILGFYVGVSVVTCLEIFGYAARYISIQADRRSRAAERQISESQADAPKPLI